MPLAPPILAVAEGDGEGFPCGAFCEFVIGRTEQEWLGPIAEFLYPGMFQILLILLGAYFAHRLVRRAIKRFVRRLATSESLSMLGKVRRMAPLADTTPINLSRSTMRAETIAGVLRSIAGFAIWGIAALLILGVFGIDLGPFIAGAGIAGVALGFGAQKLVQDFLSGLFMLMEDQYGIGDIVNTGEATGVIEGITLRTTRLRDVYGTVWHVPNGQIARIGNMSQQWSRSLLDIGVAYDTDIPFAMAVIKRVADGLWDDPEWRDNVLEEPEVWGVQAFGASEVVIRLVVKTLPAQQWAIERELRQRMKAAFDSEGIEIPFPQRTVWMRAENGDAALPPAHPVSEAATVPPARAQHSAEIPDSSAFQHETGDEGAP